MLKHTHIYACVELLANENEKCWSVPWQWESLEGPSLVDPAGTPDEKSPPSHPSWDATQQNITRSHRQFRRSAARFYPPWKLFLDSWKTILRDFELSTPIFPA